MSEELNERLIGYLDTIEQTVSDGAGLAMDQAPAVAWEIVAYNRAMSTAFVFFGSLLLLSAVVYVKRSKRGVTWMEWNTAHVVYPLFAITIGLTSLSRGLPAFFKSWFAPRVLILEELSKLIN